MTVFSSCIHLPNRSFSFHHWRHSECKHSSPPPHCLCLSLSVTHCCETLWTFQQRLVFQQPPRLRTTVRMSQMSFFFTRRDSWMAHSLSVKTRARHEVTSRLWSMKSGKIKKRERGEEKFNFHASLMLILTIKHSHVCSSRPDHRGELFLAFSICHIWHLCFNNSYIDYV